MTAYRVDVARDILREGGLMKVNPVVTEEQQKARLASPRFGVRLRAHREAADMTMGAMADALGVSVVVVSDVERSVTEAPPELKARMADLVKMVWP